ncbi:hypothetical protein SeLEV6574_g05676 [Synchytrium endobioticum]|uniref:Uncharacterized protein n=1 Tax=Synchytrium endobioticum TaxID=286115 RepID=A0A507CT99_9FUNG|nr:hypothetical protein SeLEV6574_g05676 [Synchytrium endobioticum]
MLTCFIIILVLWHQSLPTSAFITDAEYRSFAESLREYRHGLTVREATAPLQYEHEAAIKADPRKVEGIPDYVISLFLLLPTPENVPPEYLELARRFHQLVMYQRDNEARQIYPGYEAPELMDPLPIPDASAASSSRGAGPSSNPVMDERVAVSSAAAGDHGLSTDDFQWLSLDISRTMTEHGQVRTRGSRRQRSVPGSSNLEYRG